MRESASERRPVHRPRETRVEPPVDSFDNEHLAKEDRRFRAPASAALR